LRFSPVFCPVIFPANFGSGDEFGSHCILSHAVGSLRANMPARCFRANNQLGAAIWIVIQGSGSDVSDAQGFPRLRRFTPWLRASDRKNSIPLRRQETAALRDVNSPYVGLVSGSPRRGNPRSLRHFDGRSARFRTIQI
jgi:hypothetical protein